MEEQVGMLRHYCGAELDRLTTEPIEDCPICDTLARDNRRCVETLRKVCELRDQLKGFMHHKKICTVIFDLNKILGGLT